MPTRLIEAKPWQSCSIRKQHGGHGMVAAVQKQT
mgnify:CR=1 FL=1